MVSISTGLFAMIGLAETALRASATKVMVTGLVTQ
jgi:hypothetical protein